ncbi:ABC transporter permease, partial [Streptomyces albidoflavus]
MTTTAPQAAPAPPLPSTPRGSGRSTWLQDLLTGLRFAFGGGREGWSRTLLTAAGVGAAVAVLLGAASTPHLLAERAARGDARTASATLDPESPARSDSTVLYSTAESDYRSETIWGTYLKAEGKAPALPPGLPGLPADGEMYASPALRDLLGTEEGALLRERLPQKIVGTIGDAGLVNPGELLFYAGHDALAPGKAARTDGFGLASEGDDLAPALIILITLMCVVLLTPVAVFIATAVRFGGERRDRRRGRRGRGGGPPRPPPPPRRRAAAAGGGGGRRAG